MKINTSPEKFHDEAAAAGSFKNLEENWYQQMVANGTNVDFWPDFPLFAVKVLWMRLGTDIVVPDLIKEKLCCVFQATANGEPDPLLNGFPRKVSAALEVVTYLKQYDPSDRPARIREIDDACGYYDYFEWLNEVVDDYGADHPDEFSEMVAILVTCDRR